VHLHTHPAFLDTLDYQACLILIKNRQSIYLVPTCNYICSTALQKQKVAREEGLLWDFCGTALNNLRANHLRQVLVQGLHCFKIISILLHKTIKWKMWENKNCNTLYDSPLLPVLPLSDQVMYMTSCLTVHLPVPGVSMGRSPTTAAA